MGQYYLIVNIDKEQYLYPHKFGDGLKLMEFGNSACGTLLGLAVLLANGNNRGGGDLRTDHPMVGHWAGDRVVVAGDYGDEGEFLDGLDDAVDAAADDYDVDPDSLTLYAVANSQFTDVSDAVIRAVVDGEGDRHPLAGIDFDDDGWRSKKEWGE